MNVPRKFRGKLCMVCDTQATRFLQGYCYCDYHDRETYRKRANPIMLDQVKDKVSHRHDTTQYANACESDRDFVHKQILACELAKTK